MKNLRSFIFASAAVILCAGLYQTLSAASEGDKAPEWTLTNLEGKEVSAGDFEDKVVILDFWATWCPPCREEIPGFIELQEEYGGDGLQVIGVSLDQKGPQVVREFAEQYKINYPLVMGDQAVTQAFGGIRAIPTTFIIDREGKIVSKHVGFVPKEQFEKEIKPLL